MRIIAPIFFVVACIASHAETNNPAGLDTHAKEQLSYILQFCTPHQDWITNYYGKTLSSLGKIDIIRVIDHKIDSSPSWTHSDLWKIIEESKIGDCGDGAHICGEPPRFSIEYVDGLKVVADRTSVLIILTDGQKCSACLYSDLTK